MSISANALALSRTLTEFKPQQVTLRPLTYEGCARLSLWLEERAAIAMQRLIRSGAVSEKAAVSGHLVNVATCRYEPGGDAFQDALDTSSGFRKLLELMIDAPADDFTNADGITTLGARSLSFEIMANDTARKEAERVVAELNNDPLATRGRTIPAPAPVAPNR